MALPPHGLPSAAALTASPRTRGVFYGWWIVAAGIATQFAYSMQNNSTFGVFLYYMNAELGWSRTLLSAPQSLGQIPAAITAALVGPLVDRFGTRWFIGFGGLVLGGAFLALSTIQDPWQFYLYRGLLSSIGAVCVGGFIGVTISNWFVQKRGQVLGYMGMGGSLGTGPCHWDEHPGAGAPVCHIWR